jgi:hypothetical protein
LIEVAEVRRFFIAGNLGKRFFALFGYTDVVMAAVNTGAQLGTAMRALIAATDLTGDEVESLSTLSTARHGAGIFVF